MSDEFLPPVAGSRRGLPPGDAAVRRRNTAGAARRRLAALLAEKAARQAPAQMISWITPPNRNVGLASLPVRLTRQWRVVPEDARFIPEYVGPIEAAIRATALYFDMTREELLARRRGWRTVHRRHIAMYLAKRHSRASLTEIGRRFGDFDHTTVMHAVARINGLIGIDETVLEHVNAVTALMEQMKGPGADHG